MRAKLSVPNKLQANLPRKTSIYAVLCHTMNYSYIKIIKNDSIRSDATSHACRFINLQEKGNSIDDFGEWRKTELANLHHGFRDYIFQGIWCVGEWFHHLNNFFCWLFSHCINLPIRIIEPFFFLQFDKRMIDRSNRNQSHHQQSMYKICNNCAVAWSQHMINSLQFWMD